MDNLEDSGNLGERRPESVHHTVERPSTPAESQYSLDLAALELDSPSGVSTPLPQQHVDRVASDDIDGPTDFTLNLGKWMRGGSHAKHIQNTNKSLELLDRGDPRERPNSTFDLSKTVGWKIEDETRDENEDRHAMLANSPLGRHVGSERNDDGDFQVRSPTPETQEKPSARDFLQPTVEEYHSELSPSRASIIAPVQSTQPQKRSFSSQTAEAESETRTAHNLDSSKNALLTDTISELKRNHAADRQRLLEQMERDRAEHRRELRVIEHELELAQRNRDNAAASAKAYKEELDEARSTYESEMVRSESELQHSYALQAQVDTLTKQLGIATEENSDLVAQIQSANALLSSAQMELSDIKRSRTEQPVQTTTPYASAIKESETLRRQMNELQEQLRAERNQHKIEMDRLRDEGQLSPEEQQRLHEELEAKQSLLNDALIERDALQDDLQASQSDLSATQSALRALQSELEGMQEDLSDLRAVNAMMDDRLSDALRRREAYWRVRLADIDSERKVMAKALLKQWGEGELGLEEPLQRYVYRYAKQRKKSAKGEVINT